jgi:predicted TIM-barrel fold metal-dependent hydrolase
MFVKLSQIIHAVNGKVTTRLADYARNLDALVQIFGEDRVIFGSDYPNSDTVTAVENVFRIARKYYATRPRRVAEKFFWRNSQAVYKWQPRTSGQRALGS